MSNERHICIHGRSGIFYFGDNNEKGFSKEDVWFFRRKTDCTGMINCGNG